MLEALPLDIGDNQSKAEEKVWMSRDPESIGKKRKEKFNYYN